MSTPAPDPDRLTGKKRGRRYPSTEGYKKMVVTAVAMVAKPDKKNVVGTGALSGLGTAEVPVMSVPEPKCLPSELKGESKELISCEVCKQNFLNREELVKHMIAHCNQKELQICQICKRTFALKSHLMTHMRTHKESTVPGNTTAISSNNVDTPIMMADGLGAGAPQTNGRPRKLHACQLCSKSFLRKGLLTAHVRTHTGERPFVCRVCNRGFAQEGNLKKHYRIHTGEKPFKCNVCNRSFKEKNHLTKHMRIHSGEKPYKCNMCNKQFSRKYALTVHMRIHTGEKPYVCNVCHKAFTVKCTLVKHQRLHTAK